MHLGKWTNSFYVSCVCTGATRLVFLFIKTVVMWHVTFADLKGNAELRGPTPTPPGEGEAGPRPGLRAASPTGPGARGLPAQYLALIHVGSGCVERSFILLHPQEKRSPNFLSRRVHVFMYLAPLDSRK